MAAMRARTTLAAAILTWLSLASAAEAQPFVLPIEGDAYEAWTIVNYTDVDDAPGEIRDYRGGSFTYDGHAGADYTLAHFAQMDAGVDVYAADGGTVFAMVESEYDRYSISNPTDGSAGNYLWIDHGDGVLTSYYHLKKNSCLVEVGDVVVRGEKIAEVGSSGNSTGPHLHFEIYEGGQVVEPMQNPSRWWDDPPPTYAGDVAGALASGILHRGPTQKEMEDLPPVDRVFYQDEGAGQQAWIWTTLHGTHPGDDLEFFYFRPDGSQYARFAWDPGLIKYSWWTAYAILPNEPDLGTWRISVRVNGDEIVSQTFEVAATRPDPDPDPDPKPQPKAKYVIDRRPYGPAASYMANAAWTDAAQWLGGGASDPYAYYAYVYAYYAVAFDAYCQGVTYDDDFAKQRDAYVGLRHYQSLYSYHAQVYASEAFYRTYDYQAYEAWLYSYYAYAYASYDL